MIASVQDTTSRPYVAGSLAVPIDGLEVPDRCPSTGTLFGDRLLGVRPSQAWS